MSFALSGSTANQSGTDNNSVNLIPINGFNALAGNRQIEGSSRQINVAGNYTVRESMRLQRFVVTATGNLTLGQVDGSGVVMPCIIYLTSTTGFAYPSQAISCDNGATLSLNNSVVVVETGNNNAGFGSFNKLNWTFNALNSEIIHEQRAWDYLAGNGVIKNLTVRNTRCIFFHGSPTELSNLTVIDTEWGIGIDNSTGATVRVTKSKTPRSMIQRGNNYFNMVDTQITEWIGSRFEPSATSGWRFIKTMQTASVGALANANTTAHTLASDNSTLDSTTLGADGSLVKEVQWGRVLGNVAGLSSSPANLSNKMTVAMINTNTGTYKHVAGDYKLPLAVAFVSYNGELQVQEGITFDVSADAYRDNFIMAPNLGVDPLVTELSQAVANAYTTQVGSIRLYDKGKASFATNYTNERAVYISRVGDTLVLGSKSFMATSSSTFSQSITSIVATAAVWTDNITTTGAVILDAIAEDKTIDGASSVKLTTLPTQLTIKNSAQGLVIESAGTYDVSQFTFEGNTADITKIGSNQTTVKTGGKTITWVGDSGSMSIDDSVIHTIETNAVGGVLAAQNIDKFKTFKGQFADNAARDAAVPSPVSGDYYRDNTGFFTYYTGTTWSSNGVDLDVDARNEFWLSKTSTSSPNNSQDSSPIHYKRADGSTVNFGYPEALGDWFTVGNNLWVRKYKNPDPYSLTKMETTRMDFEWADIRLADHIHMSFPRFTSNGTIQAELSLPILVGSNNSRYAGSVTDLIDLKKIHQVHEHYVLPTVFGGAGAQASQTLRLDPNTNYRLVADAYGLKRGVSEFNTGASSRTSLNLEVNPHVPSTSLIPQALPYTFQMSATPPDHSSLITQFVPDMSALSFEQAKAVVEVAQLSEAAASGALGANDPALVELGPDGVEIKNNTIRFMPLASYPAKTKVSIPMTLKEIGYTINANPFDTNGNYVCFSSASPNTVNANMVSVGGEGIVKSELVYDLNELKADVKHVADNTPPLKKNIV